MSSGGFVSWDTIWEKKEMVTTDRGKINVYSLSGPGPFAIFCIHGAGHSALSFSLFAQQMKGVASVFAFDLKCHGETEGDPAKDLSIENLAKDSASVINALQPEHTRTILIGHSLGGSIIVHTVPLLNSKPFSCVVIDTIEGLALAAMPRMNFILSSRPKSFNSEREAINYISTSGEMMNSRSAALSAPGRIKMKDGSLTWITDLRPSEPYWNGWFKGFADLFLKTPGFKILILTNINNMDTPFVIGHMSGKFQLEIVGGANHCIHEDYPDSVAKIIKDFIKRILDDPYSSQNLFK